MARDSNKENSDFKIGDLVRASAESKINTPRSNGEIVTLSKDGKKAEVLFGGLRCWLACDALTVVPIKKSSKHSIKKSKTSKISIKKKKNHAKKELDLHGMRAEQAKEKCLCFLSDAILGELEFVEIIHGLGTGRLKEVVHQILTNSIVVKNFRLKEGNPGTTIVYF